MAAVFFEDDFTGAASNAFPTAAAAGTAWGKKLVQTAGTPIVGTIANGVGGQAKILLDATSEDQEAVLYFLDNLSINTALIGGFEVRFQCPEIPTGNVQAALGLQSSYVAGPDNNTCYIRAGLRGSAAAKHRPGIGARGRARAERRAGTVLAPNLRHCRWTARFLTELQDFGNPAFRWTSTEGFVHADPMGLLADLLRPRGKPPATVAEAEAALERLRAERDRANDTANELTRRRAELLLRDGSDADIAAAEASADAARLVIERQAAALALAPIVEAPAEPPTPLPDNSMAAVRRRDEARTLAAADFRYGTSQAHRQAQARALAPARPAGY